MGTASREATWTHVVVANCGVATVYFLAALVGLALAVPPGYATAIWPASGVALVAVLVGGARWAPGIWLGSTLAHCLVSGDGTGAFGVTLQLSATLGVGATAQALVARGLVERAVGRDDPLQTPRAIFAFLGLAGPVACLINAAWGPICLWLAGRVGPYALAIDIWTWWVGDTLGVLVFGTLGALAVRRPRDRRLVVVAGPLLAGFALAVTVFVLFSQEEEARIAAEFQREAHVVSDALGLALAAPTIAVQTAEALGADGVDEAGRAPLAGHLVRQTPHLERIGWAPYDAGAGWQYPSGPPPPAPAERHATQGILRERIDEAGRLHMSLAGETGVAFADIDVQGLVRGVLDRFPMRGVEVEVARRAPGAPSWVVRHGGPEGATLRAFGTAPAGAWGWPAFLKTEDGLDFGSADWRVRYAATPAHVEVVHSLSAWAVFAAALAFTAVLGAGLLILTGRTEQVEAQVRGRTAALAREVEQHREARAALAQLAFHDDLTGLVNRKLFMSRLEEALQRAPRLDTRVTVLFLDLDHFKDVNDLLGHAAGDALLVEVARALEDATRETDVVGRFGGDEFAILTEGHNEPEAAVRLANRLIERVRAPWSIRGREVRVATSVGIAESVGLPPGADVETVAQNLLEAADVALYQAKHQGRSTYCVHEDRMSVAERERIEMGMALEEAIRLDRELEIHLQPQHALDDGRLVGFEALARWTSPRWGAVSPARFLPIVESKGLIADLDRLVLRRACEFVRDWSARGGPAVPVAVNISALELRAEDFVPRFLDVVRTVGVDPRRIEVELTEGAVIRDFETVRGRLLQLRDAGLTLALDDFGTGYSSLLYLRQLPLRRLKIAREFVSGVLDNDVDLGIVRTTLAMCESLGLEAVAEGIEDHGVAERLLHMGCPVAQGWHFGRPQPVPTVLERVHTPEPA